MNFKLARFFYVTISFITGIFFFLFGAFGIVLPWSPFLQKATAQFILENTLMLSLFGLGFALMGLSILIYTILSTRHRTILVRTGTLAVAVDENVIHQYLEAYWQEHFPKSPISFSLTFKKHALQIAADLPYMPMDEQKIFLDGVKDDFSDLFGRVLGYPYDVHLIASFQDKPEKPSST